MWGATFKSFNSNTLATADYTARFVEADNPNLQPTANPILIRRGHRPPVFTTQSVQEKYIVLMVDVIDSVNIQTLTDTLKKVFDPSVNSLKTLIVTDSSAVDWELEATVTNHTTSGLIHRITLMAPDGIWYKTSVTTGSLWTVTATGQTTTFTPTGTHQSFPTIKYDPQAVRTGSYAYRRFITIYNQSNKQFDNYPVEVTGGGLDTGALTTAKMQADGDDFRIEVDGAEVPRWLADMDTASTSVWINLDLDPKVELELEGALGTGAITEMNFTQTNSTRNKLNRLPSKGLLLIESELFHFTAVNPDKWKVTIDNRGIKDTTAATHADALTVRWIQHSIKMLYGVSTVAAPDQTDVEKPILNLSTSTNTSWVWAEFDDSNAGKESVEQERRRTGTWLGTVRRSTGGESRNYTGVRTLNADPATEMGMTGSNWLQGDAGRSELFRVIWELYHPAGATHATLTGENYRESTVWATKKSGLQYSATGDSGDWITDSTFVFTTPSSAQAWEANNVVNTIFSTAATYRHLRWVFAGELSAAQISGSPHVVHQSVTALTLTLDSSNTPSVSLGAENGTSYSIDLNLRNETTDEEFTLRYAMKFGETVTINCADKTVTYDEDGTSIFNALIVPAQAEWMTLAPTTNTITFTQAGVSDEDLTFTWQERDGGF